MIIAWLEETDECGSDNGYVDSGRVFQLLDCGAGWEVYPSDCGGDALGRFGSLESAMRWAGGLINRIVKAYGPADSSTGECPEKSTFKPGEVLDQLDAGGEGADPLTAAQGAE